VDARFASSLGLLSTTSWGSTLTLLYAIWQQLRSQKGLNQEKAAEALGVNVRTVQRWESGKHEPRLQHVLQMRQLYQENDDMQAYHYEFSERDIAVRDRIAEYSARGDLGRISDEQSEMLYRFGIFPDD
jgi:transcriptional regulator with XRE-family HTH domain